MFYIAILAEIKKWLHIKECNISSCIYINAFRNAPNYINSKYLKNQFPSNILHAYVLVIRLQSVSLYNTVLTFFLGVVEGLLDVILVHIVDKKGARDELSNAPHHESHPYHDP